jgi:hypothetical protein
LFKKEYFIVLCSSALGLLSITYLAVGGGGTLWILTPGLLFYYCAIEALFWSLILEKKSGEVNRF